MERFIVLRDEARIRRTGPFGRGMRDLGGAGTLSVPEPSIQVEEVDRQGKAELLSDPAVVAGCPEIPLRLIEPLATDEASADGHVRVWGIAAVGADTSPFTGARTTVAVLDTGIDAAHPAFAGVELIEQDFTGHGNGDRKGHGTHCAGTIFGRPVDGERIGVAPGVTRALIGKVLGDDGRGSSATAFEGIEWARANGAQVISMSLGFDYPGMVTQLEEEGWPTDLATSKALEAFSGNLRLFDAQMALMRRAGILGSDAVVVAAAGNESRRDLHQNYEIATSLPAAAEEVISVGALGEGDSGLTVGWFSNTFPRVAAPGVAIKSAKTGGGLTVMDGTSMACPHVAGVAALWWEAARAKGMPATAQTVAALLVASGRTDALDASVDLADRGTGLVTAPQQ
jgi:subtilisin family serine protease